jgi:hypothetical protein
MKFEKPILNFAYCFFSQCEYLVHKLRDSFNLDLDFLRHPKKLILVIEH